MKFPYSKKQLQKAKDDVTKGITSLRNVKTPQERDTLIVEVLGLSAVLVSMQTANTGMMPPPRVSENGETLISVGTLAAMEDLRNVTRMHLYLLDYFHGAYQYQYDQFYAGMMDRMDKKSTVGDVPSHSLN